MSISGIGGKSAFTVQALIDMRAQLTDLQRQLGTGKRSVSYAGLGLDRGLAVGLRARMTSIDGYRDTITNVGVRLSMAQTSLSRIGEIGRSVKSMAGLSPFDVDASGQTAAQKNARSLLDEVLGLLNAQSGDRYLFSGRGLDRPAVEPLARILDGDATHAGLKQIIAERNQADLGVSGLGRLVIPPAAGTSVSVNEDVAGSPFGFKLAGISTTIGGASTTGPSGAPPTVSVNMPVNALDGQAVRFTFQLPDGSTEELTLTARLSPDGAGQFAIGATAAATAANMQAALTAEVGRLARTSLSAASAIAASRGFFDVDSGQPPLRVAGPPFGTATALIAGTTANTVHWYIGEMGTDPARGTAVARVDEAISVSYGIRANEQALRWTVEHVAVFATMTYSQSDPDAASRFAAVNERLGPALDYPPHVQTIENIQAELAGAQNTLQSAKERHQQTYAALEDLLVSIEGVSQEEAGAQIIALQTRLQASLQTTAMLYRTSIVDYL